MLFIFTLMPTLTVFVFYLPFLYDKKMSSWYLTQP